MAAAEAPPAWSIIALATLSLFLIGGLFMAGLLYRTNRSLRTRLQKQEEQLASAREEAQDQATVLLETEREMARLKRIPKAELLPMLQLTHELRSPLAAVEHSLEMILQGYTDNDPKLRDEMLALSQDRTKMMLARVNDFLRLGAVKYAEIERQPRQVQLLDVLKRLTPELRIRARWVAVDLNLELPEALPTVKATTEDMEHLLSNLVNNAIKYTNPGGKVTVSFREERDRVIGVVADTGIGIAPEEIPRIFDEFYRAESAKGKAPGTGLGLSIVKRVVGLYGGDIHVESEVGKGSRFIFSFPALGQATAATR